jgi:hypothetical protein
MKSSTRDLNRLNSTMNDQDELISNSNYSARRVIEWSFENEEILAEWCDIAQCYKWLNTETYKYYKNVNSYLTIPCIICSTVSGSASFGIPNVQEEYQYIIPFLIGSITICVGIITTIQQYYRFSELKETHRILAVAWDKLARNIRIELAKSPMERIDARHFIKFTRIEFDRLMENSEIIPDTIINKFNKKINKNENAMKSRLLSIKNMDLEKGGGIICQEEIKNFNNNLLKKPDICDTVVSINVNRKLWFEQDNGQKGNTSIDESFYLKNSKSRSSLKKRRVKNTTSSNNDTSDEEPFETLKTIPTNMSIYSYITESGKQIYSPPSPEYYVSHSPQQFPVSSSQDSIYFYNNSGMINPYTNNTNENNGNNNIDNIEGRDCSFNPLPI